MNAKERLADALTKAGAPARMIANARYGQYDDFASRSATPLMDLVRDCRNAGLLDIANRAMDGEFDAD